MGSIKVLIKTKHLVNVSQRTLVVLRLHKCRDFEIRLGASDRKKIKLYMCLEKKKGNSEHRFFHSVIAVKTVSGSGIYSYQNSGKKQNIFIGFYEISQINIRTSILSIN